MCAGSLLDRIQASRLHVDEAHDIAGQMMHGLAHMHSRGVIHRDIKPANILCCNKYDTVICDFGLAANYPAQDLEDLDVVGSFPYMSPEMLQGLPYDETASLSLP